MVSLIIEHYLGVIDLFYCDLSTKCTVLQDNSLEFEKRRNTPVKYRRELWDKTGNKLVFFPTAISVKTWFFDF